ncbi:hypothetical protein ACB094_03G050400 [Castanea mollissima]
MFLNISLPIPTIMLFILRKNVQLAKYQNLPGPSTAAFVIAVLLALTIIVDGCSSLVQNNCIGEINTGYFMAFLLWHFLLCIYGAVTIGLILAGRLKELRVKYI